MNSFQQGVDVCIKLLDWLFQIFMSILGFFSPLILIFTVAGGIISLYFFIRPNGDKR